MRKIVIDKREYTIDLDRAKALGILQELKPWTTTIGTVWQEEQSGGFYLLASVDFNKALLVNVRDGTRWGFSVDIKDPFNISKEEFDKLSGGSTWGEVNILKMETKKIKE